MSSKNLDKIGKQEEHLELSKKKQKTFVIREEKGSQSII